MNGHTPYETLDPEDWGKMRALAHRMVDDALTYLETVRERPVWQPVPQAVAARLKVPAPREPAYLDRAVDEIRALLAASRGRAFVSELGELLHRRFNDGLARDPAAARTLGRTPARARALRVFCGTTGT